MSKCSELRWVSSICLGTNWESGLKPSGLVDIEEGDLASTFRVVAEKKKWVRKQPYSSFIRVLT